MSECSISDEYLSSVASKLKGSSYREPIGFLLESHIPAFTILYSIFLCTEPFIAPFISADFSRLLHALYRDPEKREWFLDQLTEEA